MASTKPTSPSSRRRKATGGVDRTDALVKPALREALAAAYPGCSTAAALIRAAIKGLGLEESPNLMPRKTGRPKGARDRSGRRAATPEQR
ncbi:hypothetical protein [Azospirillum soli]|uniref:hypothetical protein n=1 Tax=Azospirillum soli TaxID=1304799 RepID=UPI001AE35FE6|nr:hypothetical protein [Azospirillum soli]MBP2315528.1 hypothetical protein [Azospirillum soli]